MQDDLPIIDLDGYRRLEAQERELARSPVAVALAGVTAIGLLLAAAGGALLLGSLPAAGWDHEAIGCALALAGALIFAACLGLGRAYLFRRLTRLRCAHCGGTLGRYVADLTEAERGRWREKGIYLDGRRYSAPFIGESDQRSWVRAMKEVWACL
jgi:hypothetical protein